MVTLSTDQDVLGSIPRYVRTMCVSMSNANTLTSVAFGGGPLHFVDYRSGEVLKLGLYVIHENLSESDIVISECKEDNEKEEMLISLYRRDTIC